MEEQVEIAVEFLRETKKAYLVSDGDVEAWIPKSQIEHDYTVDPKIGDTKTITLPSWLAVNKELI